MPLPSFICVGTQKGGTTSLHEILKRHSDIFLPRVKETKFFAFPERFKRGLSFYEKEYFGDCKGKSIAGEIDPLYMFLDYVPKRIYDHLGPKTKLIFMLRNPVDRAYSHYWMSYHRGYEKRPFMEVMKQDDSKEKGDLFSTMHHSYVTRGYYSKQMERFLKFFPKENIMAIIFEQDFLLHKETTISAVLNFVGARKVKLETEINANPASMPRSIPIRDFINRPNAVKKTLNAVIPSTYIKSKLKWIVDRGNQKPFSPPKLDATAKRRLLDKYYRVDIEKLEELLGRDLDVWS